MLNLENYIRIVPDFPHEGISFKDITPLLLDPKAVDYCTNELIKDIKNEKIDIVIGIESRGFFLASLMAQKLNAGFVPVRKKGKLPYKTIQAEYSLEYGSDILEMHIDAIKPGQKVVIHDDVLATGGTMEAVCNMVEKLGGIIVQCNFIIELSFLNGKNKIAKHATKAALTY